MPSLRNCKILSYFKLHLTIIQQKVILHIEFAIISNVLQLNCSLKFFGRSKAARHTKYVCTQTLAIFFDGQTQSTLKIVLSKFT